MNRIILENKLKTLGISSNYYSLNGELKLDTLVLYHNYEKWEVFYFNERGQKDNIKFFLSEEDACEYIYQTLLDLYNTIKKYNLSE